MVSALPKKLKFRISAFKSSEKIVQLDSSKHKFFVVFFMTDHHFLTSATNAVDVYMIKQSLVQLWPHISAHVGGRKKDSWLTLLFVIMKIS